MVCCLQQDRTWNAALGSEYHISRNSLAPLSPFQTAKATAKTLLMQSYRRKWKRTLNLCLWKTWCQFLHSFLHVTSRQPNWVPRQRCKGTTPPKEKPISKCSFPSFSSLTLNFSVVTYFIKYKHTIIMLL